MSEDEVSEEDVFDHEDYEENEWNDLATHPDQQTYSNHHSHSSQTPRSQHSGGKRVKNKKTDNDVWLPIGELSAMKVFTDLVRHWALLRHPIPFVCVF